MERNTCRAFALRGAPRFAVGQLVVEKSSETVNTLEVLLWRPALPSVQGTLEPFSLVLLWRGPGTVIEPLQRTLLL